MLDLERGKQSLQRWKEVGYKVHISRTTRIVSTLNSSFTLSTRSIMLSLIEYLSSQSHFHLNYLLHNPTNNALPPPSSLPKYSLRHPSL